MIFGEFRLIEIQIFYLVLVPEKLSIIPLWQNITNIQEYSKPILEIWPWETKVEVIEEEPNLLPKKSFQLFSRYLLNFDRQFLPFANRQILIIWSFSTKWLFWWHRCWWRFCPFWSPTSTIFFTFKRCHQHRNSVTNIQKSSPALSHQHHYYYAVSSTFSTK